MSTSLQTPPQGVLYQAGSVLLPAQLSGSGLDGQLINGQLVFSTAQNQPLGVSNYILATDTQLTTHAPGISTAFQGLPTYTSGATILTANYNIPSATGVILVRIYMSAVMPVVTGNWGSVLVCLFDSNSPTALPFMSATIQQYFSASTGYMTAAKKLANQFLPVNGSFPSSVTVYVNAYNIGGANTPSTYPTMLSSSSPYYQGKAPFQLLIQEVAG